MYCDALVLYLIHQFRGDRTISGIYHLLKGKKSSQSVQDSYLFHVKPFFHSCDDLDRHSFQTLVERLNVCGWIQSAGSEQMHFILSTEGERQLTRFDLNKLIPDGLCNTDQVNDEGNFWLKLQLSVQTISALQYHQSAFLPITRQPSVTESVRKRIMKASLNRDQLASQLHHELHQLLLPIPLTEADLFAAQLTGFRMTGLTTSQIADSTGKDPYECRILFKSALRRIMKEVAEHKATYPFIAGLMKQTASTLSLTAGETFHLLKEGLSLQQVAKRRNLSVSTIEDHLVEITLKERNFNSSDFLSHELEQQIVETANQLNTRQLKSIKNQLHDEISYLQIRLALAKNTVQKGSLLIGENEETSKR
ncbi:helix-turn-helix domain-containing protein [Sporolactobacillus nakayamae]|uniref:Uncharacterized protein YpbB n=1 Tax=Sporolactobacillus nakayamae TaxID=269670 RepID=A0A1I2MWF0_9BACL|nr:helix-turn-helix domain-containing protein [Sporolactobacillus nakayamae]SFF94989.1 Uncharacterized protein YpbB [Sporolactobacillus nakayamae]